MAGKVAGGAIEYTGKGIGFVLGGLGDALTKITSGSGNKPSPVETYVGMVTDESKSISSSDLDKFSG